MGIADPVKQQRAAHNSYVTSRFYGQNFTAFFEILHDIW